MIQPKILSKPISKKMKNLVKDKIKRVKAKEERKTEKIRNRLDNIEGSSRMMKKELNLVEKYLRGAHDLTHSSDASKVLTNFFDYNSPPVRSYADGVIPTIIGEYIQTFTVTIPAGTYFNFAWAPANIYAGTYLAYAYGAGATSFYNPFTVVGGAANATIVSNAYGSSSNIDPKQFRVIKNQLRMTNTSPQLTTGGQCRVAYTPALTQSTIDLTNANLSTNITWTEAGLSTNYWNRVYGYNERPQFNWVPNDGESMYGYGFGGEQGPASGFYGYYFNGGSGNMVIYVEFLTAIETGKTNNNTGFTSASLSTINPACEFLVNQFIAQHKNAVLSTVTESETIMSQLRSGMTEEEREEYLAKRERFDYPVNSSSNLATGIQLLSKSKSDDFQYP